MDNRKKWWNVGLLQYSITVRIYYFLTLFFMIFGSNVLIRAYLMLPEIDWKFYVSILIICCFVFTLYQCIRKMKKEYEEKDHDNFSTIKPKWYK